MFLVCNKNISDSFLYCRVFLVRDSRSNPGAFVLTYKCGGKVLHTQITPILDPVREAHVFSLDNGFTKFYDLLQLVEFYQLNAGVLPTRLTHYVVQSPTGISVPTSTVPPSAAGSFWVVHKLDFYKIDWENNRIF